LIDLLMVQRCSCDAKAIGPITVSVRVAREKAKRGAPVSNGAAVGAVREQTLREPTHGCKVMCSGDDALPALASAAALPVGRDPLGRGVRGADGLRSGEDGVENEVHGGGWVVRMIGEMRGVVELGAKDG
jgi:hypothetical protein